MRAKFTLIAALLVAWGSALAHHSFSGEFDVNKPVILRGVVTKVEWLNPHVWFYLDVKSENGVVQHWQCESGPPNMLMRSGWRKDSLKIGDEISVNGFQSKDGTNTASAKDVILANGKKVFSGSADEVGARQ